MTGEILVTNCVTDDAGNLLFEVPIGNKICLVIDKRPDEPWPVARYYYEPEDESDWHAHCLREIQSGYTVTINVVSADRVGKPFDHREAEGTA